jgi:hypothetical protein
MASPWQVHLHRPFFSIQDPAMSEGNDKHDTANPEPHGNQGVEYPTPPGLE